MFSILLQTNVNDITFRTTDVGIIIAGIVSVLGTYFVLRFQAQSTKEKLEGYIVANEKELIRLEKDIEKLDVNNSDFKKEMFKRMEEQNQEIHSLGLNLEKTKNEIISQINKK